ncbi:MAG: ATP-binding protein [bacterium]
MEKKTIELDIRPDASIYNIFTRLNYKAEFALAEFIDNSTASFYDNRDVLLNNDIKHLMIEINYDKEKNELVIRDNAYGMEIDDFKRSILLAAKPVEQGGRNEFGMGLKTAATWFGRKWTVKSTQFKSKNSYTGTLDLDNISNTINITCDENEDIMSHGTEIKITKINRSFYATRTKNKVFETLNKLYSRDLESGVIQILFNGTPCMPPQMKFLTFRDTYWKRDLLFSIDYKEKTYNVNGFVGILEKGGYEKTGIQLFRRNRVVTLGYKPDKIFGQAQSQISLKLYLEIDMDDFEINQAKDGISWDEELEELFIEKLKLNIQDYINIAKISTKDREAEERNKRLGTETPTVSVSFVDTTKSYIPSNSENNTDDKKTLKNTMEQNGSDDVNTPSNHIVNVVKPNETIVVEQPKVSYIPHTFIMFNSKSYKVSLDYVENNAFIFKFNESDNELILNKNNSYVDSLSSNDLHTVGKFILAFALAEEHANNSMNNDGYIQSTVIRNQLNKILNTK